MGFIKKGILAFALAGLILGAHGLAYATVGIVGAIARQYSASPGLFIASVAVSYTNEEVIDVTLMKQDGTLLRDPTTGLPLTPSAIQDNGTWVGYFFKSSGQLVRAGDVLTAVATGSEGGESTVQIHCRAVIGGAFCN